MESTRSLKGSEQRKQQQQKGKWGNFQMPLHYPKYTKSEYEAMPEWQLNRLLLEYGLPITGDVEQKRKFAMGAFLWSKSRRSS